MIFYNEKLRRLLEFEPLANCRLDRIDEALIASYSETRKRQLSRYGRAMAPASVNRELATLRRLLRRAKDLKAVIIDVPKIELLGGERRRDFVLAHDAWRQDTSTACPQPLKDAALLMLDTALRSGEASALEWRDITLKISEGKRYGYLQVRRGKSATSIRTGESYGPRLEDAAGPQKGRQDVLRVLPARDGGPVPGTWLDRQHDGVRRALKLPADFVLHSVKTFDVDATGRGGRRCFHDQRDRRAQQHRHFAAIRASFARASGARF